MGCDEDEIGASSSNLDLLDEQEQLKAAIRLCGLDKYKTSGPLFINDGNLQVALQPELAHYYYKLIPKYLGAQRIGRPAHLTAIRKWEIDLPSSLNKYIGAKIDITYFSPVKQHGPHFIIEADSEQLIDLRLKLGLLAYRKPWNCFHFTVGFINES